MKHANIRAPNEDQYLPFLDDIRSNKAGAYVEDVSFVVQVLQQLTSAGINDHKSQSYQSRVTSVKFRCRRRCIIPSMGHAS